MANVWVVNLLIVVLIRLHHRRHPPINARRGAVRSAVSCLSKPQLQQHMLGKSAVGPRAVGGLITRAQNFVWPARGLAIVRRCLQSAGGQRLPCIVAGGASGSHGDNVQRKMLKRGVLDTKKDVYNKLKCILSGSCVSPSAVVEEGTSRKPKKNLSMLYRLWCGRLRASSWNVVCECPAQAESTQHEESMNMTPKCQQQ